MIERRYMKEKILMWLAWKMPTELVYWCSLRLGAYATQGEHGKTIVPELTFMDAIKRWEEKQDKNSIAND